MKPIITVFITLLSIVSFGQDTEGIKFRKGSWNDMLKMAKEEQKPIFVDAYAVWCGPCKWMAANTFTDEKVGNVVNDKFIAYKFDMEKGEGIDFAKKYEVRAYPTLLFIDGNGEQLHKVVGASDADGFLKVLESALDEDKRLSSLTKRFESGDRDKEFLKSYLDALMMAYQNTKEPYDAYWELMSDKEKISKEFYDLMQSSTNGFSDLKSKEFKLVKENRTAFEQLYDEGEFEKKWIGIAESSVNKILRMDEDKHKDQLMEVQRVFSEHEYLVIPYYEMLMARKNKDENFTIAMAEYGKLKSDWQLLNSAAWTNYEAYLESKDETKLAEALEWSSRSVDLEKNYFNMDTKGAVLFALGMNREAMDALQSAIEMGQEEGRDTSETQKMLDQLKAE